MSSVFRLDDNYVDKPKRNTFDLSFQNNLTLKMGNIVPVFCKEVLPGDSFRIDSRFGLKYLPQVFPVQTRQRASVKFYYVRNRPLWKDWMDFIGKTKSDVVQPYLYFQGDDNKLLRPSSLADYMGIPVHIKSTEFTDKTLYAGNPNFVKGNNYVYYPNGSIVYGKDYSSPFSILTYKSVVPWMAKMTGDQLTRSYLMSDVYGGSTSSSVPVARAIRDVTYGKALLGDNGGIAVTGTAHLFLYRKPLVPDTYSNMRVTLNGGSQNYAIVRDEQGIDYLLYLNSSVISSFVNYTYVEDEELKTKEIRWKYLVGFLKVGNSGQPTAQIKLDLNENIDLCWCDVSYEYWPFANIYNPDLIRINALPFRACQAIYNSLIRNAENNPFRIDGVEEYNKYISSDEGGATSPTDILSDYHTNWSDDRFTTALPSPQQGNAPLVGLTGVQGATLTTSTEDGTTSTLHLQVDSDTGNVMLVDGVDSNSPEYLNDAIMSAVEYGITINDLRNVNAFQRWLENNIRRGYKYKDQLMSHYGVSARYDVLDMPEFIGGMSRDVDVNQITQTTENEFGNLGDYAGQSYVTGSGHAIEKYCDEHGYIIGLMTVYPMPVYQDIIPKHLLKTSPFDYYFPEFGKIGPQPITKKELCFSQSMLEDNGDEVFGYQRAWYDYLESLDEVHGLYHTDFRNFILSRDFLQVPTLGSQFLTIDSDEINNTFYSDDDKDKILGQVYFDCKVKRPIPLIGIPSIE